MISIIICSKNKELVKSCISVISKTIGVIHEILIHENYSYTSSICSVYNSLVVKAKYPFVIFMHEDLDFYSKNWGKVIIDILSNKEIGLVGLSGTVYKSRFEGVWSAASKNTYRLSTDDSSMDSTSQSFFYRVGIIDGCFLAARKEIFQSYRFDENLKGFHGYDLDISIQVGKNLKIVVASGINFEHFSNGNQNLDWLESTFYVHRKWKSELPIVVGYINKVDSQLSDYLSAQNIYNVIFDLNYSNRLILKYYYLFVTKYFKLNRLCYTRKTLKYFFPSLVK